MVHRSPIKVHLKFSGEVWGETRTREEMTKSKGSSALKMKSSSINVLVLLQLDQRTKEVFVEFSCCVVVVIVIFFILHGLFLTDKFLKLARF